MVNLVGRDELLLQIVSHFLLGGDELGGDVSAAPPGAVWSESSKRENILSKLSSPDKYIATNLRRHLSTGLSLLNGLNIRPFG